MLAIQAGTRSRGSDLCTMPVSVRVRDRISVIQSSPRQFTVCTLADIEHGVARPAPAPTPCWKTSFPGRREASTPSWRAGSPKSWCPTAPEQPHPPAQGYALRPTNPNALSHVSTEELLLELRRRIIAPRDRRHDTWDDWDGGLDPQGDWPEEG